MNTTTQDMYIRRVRNGNFKETTVIEGYGNHESKIADLDGDGDYDILGKPYNWEAPRIDIWINEGTP